MKGKKRLTKTSSVADYVREIEEGYQIEPDMIGERIVALMRTRSKLYSNGSEYFSREHKKNLVDSIHYTMRRLWIDLKFGRFDEEEEVPTYRFTDPDESTLEGTVEMMREAAEDETLMFHCVRDALVSAADEYYSAARIPYKDKWMIYDLMKTKLEDMVTTQQEARDAGQGGVETDE